MNLYFSTKPKLNGETIALGFVGDDLIVAADGQPAAFGQLDALPAVMPMLGIGELDGRPCLTQCWPAATPLPPGLAAVSLRNAHDLLSPPMYQLATRAKLLHTWDRQHRFCGACATPTEMLESEPARRCPACGQVSYPRLSPAIMVLIHRGDELLLARSPHFKPGVYSALAGFVDAGEGVEECVHREVMEEVGLSVTNLRWFSSQSWPFPHSLMLAFHADYAEGEIRPQPDEIEDAKWVNKAALRAGEGDVLLPNPVSISHRLIRSALD